MKTNTPPSTEGPTPSSPDSSQRVKIVLDTSCLLYEALAFQAFKKADVYIPFAVLEEIDLFKRDMSEKGRNARHFNRCMDALRGKGSLTGGIWLNKSSSRLFVALHKEATHPDLNLSKTDHRILALALHLKQTHPACPVKLITKDIHLRIKADVFGIRARDYKPDPVPDFEDIYTGIKTLSLPPESLKKFQEDKALPLHHLPSSLTLYPHQYLVLEAQTKDPPCPGSRREPGGNGTTKPSSSGTCPALGRYNADQKRVEGLNPLSDPVYGIYPGNREQSFALDALLNDKIMLVSLLGKAGTGKTLLALAAGLHKTLHTHRFQKLLMARPVFPMGRDIGYLPGDIGQKLNPYMQPLFDSMELLMSLSKKPPQAAGDLLQQGLVHIAPLATIRGRSISGQYLIVDEAQNLTPHEIKTVLTRAGQGTKVVLTGDLHQIDNPYVDSANNGLVVAVEKFKPCGLAAHITLKKGERSALAGQAASLL